MPDSPSTITHYIVIKKGTLELLTLFRYTYEDALDKAATLSGAIVSNTGEYERKHGFGSTSFLIEAGRE